MKQSFPELGVNIDHVATLRNSRAGFAPDPLSAAVLVKSAGATQLVCHLREDRRHIRDADLRLLRSWNGLPVNLEMAMTDEMVSIALDVRPALVTLVPERREERTTEGGLVLGRDMCERISVFLKKCRDNGIRLSLFWLLFPEIWNGRWNWVSTRLSCIPENMRTPWIPLSGKKNLSAFFSGSLHFRQSGSSCRRAWS